MLDLASKIVILDIDNTLTDNHLIDIGATMWVGDRLWRIAKRTGYAETLMLKAKARPEALELIRLLHAVGWTVVLVTAREERYRQVTTEWLRRQGLVLPLVMLPNNFTGNVGAWKATRIKALFGCIYVDDSLDNCYGVLRDCGDSVLVFHAASWPLMVPVIRKVTGC